LMRQVGKEETIFMHDLPASRGDEVTDAIMDGGRSRIRRQAGNKTTSAMVVLKKMLAENGVIIPEHYPPRRTHVKTSRSA